MTKTKRLISNFFSKNFIILFLIILLSSILIYAQTTPPPPQELTSIEITTFTATTSSLHVEAGVCLKYLEVLPANVLFSFESVPTGDSQTPFQQQIVFDSCTTQNRNNVAGYFECRHSAPAQHSLTWISDCRDENDPDAIFQHGEMSCGFQDCNFNFPASLTDNAYLYIQSIGPTLDDHTAASATVVINDVSYLLTSDLQNSMNIYYREITNLLSTQNTLNISVSSGGQGRGIRIGIGSFPRCYNCEYSTTGNFIPGDYLFNGDLNDGTLDVARDQATFNIPAAQTFCPANDQRDCSSQYAGTGICTFGDETCLTDGSSWGSCTAVWPGTEICDDTSNLDEDCDGYANCDDPDCAGSTGAVIVHCPPEGYNITQFSSYYTDVDGPNGPEDAYENSTCRWGNLTCGSSSCPGSVAPSTENCADAGNLDEDCDGKSNCDDSDCVGTLACPLPDEICDNDIDDDEDGLKDCADYLDCCDSGYCADTRYCKEICDNGVDDPGDVDLLVDCADTLDCCSAPNCIGNLTYCPPPEENCNLAGDEDKNNECDYDGAACDGKGDVKCEVNMTAITGQEAICPGESFSVSCTSTVGNIDSVKATIDGMLCTEPTNPWVGNVKRFTCYAPTTAGNYNVKCMIDLQKTYSTNNTKEYTITVGGVGCCGDYADQTICDADGDCGWCSECGGNGDIFYSGSTDRCIAAGACNNVCEKNQCGATCDANNLDCSSKNECTGYANSEQECIGCLYDVYDCVVDDCLCVPTNSYDPDENINYCTGCGLRWKGDGGQNNCCGDDVDDCPIPPEDCTNGIDDDGDSYADCDDSDCLCNVPECDWPLYPICRSTEICTDGIDNDDDGLIDCNDIEDCCQSTFCSGNPPCTCASNDFILIQGDKTFKQKRDSSMDDMYASFTIGRMTRDNDNNLLYPDPNGAKQNDPKIEIRMNNIRSVQLGDCKANSSVWKYGDVSFPKYFLLPDLLDKTVDEAIMPYKNEFIFKLNLDTMLLPVSDTTTRLENGEDYKFPIHECIENTNAICKVNLTKSLYYDGNWIMDCPDEQERVKVRVEFEDIKAHEYTLQRLDEGRKFQDETVETINWIYNKIINPINNLCSIVPTAATALRGIGSPLEISGAVLNKVFGSWVPGADTATKIMYLGGQYTYCAGQGLMKEVYNKKFYGDLTMATLCNLITCSPMVSFGDMAHGGMADAANDFFSFTDLDVSGDAGAVVKNILPPLQFSTSQNYMMSLGSFCILGVMEGFKTYAELKCEQLKCNYKKELGELPRDTKCSQLFAEEVCNNLIGRIFNMIGPFRMLEQLRTWVLSWLDLPGRIVGAAFNLICTLEPGGKGFWGSGGQGGFDAKDVKCPGGALGDFKDGNSEISFTGIFQILTCHVPKAYVGVKRFIETWFVPCKDNPENTCINNPYDGMFDFNKLKCNFETEEKLVSVPRSVQCPSNPIHPIRIT